MALHRRADSCKHLPAELYRGTLARVASEWQPESSEEDMLRLLHLLRDVACGLKLLNSQNIVHADLVSMRIVLGQ